MTTPMTNIDTGASTKTSPSTIEMFNLGASMGGKGNGYIILNVLRGFNLIGLALVMVASWVMIVLSGLTGQFFFFDFLSHIWRFAIAVGLAISELGLVKMYFASTWPVLSEGHSLAWLGLAMMVLGTEILGGLNKAVYSINNVGLAYWRLILASGILAITFGCFNILASVLFRDSKNGITARGIRADGNLAQAKLDDVSSHGELFPPRTATPRAATPRAPTPAPAMAEPRMNPIARLLGVRHGKGNGNPQKPKISGPISAPMPVVAESSDLETGTAPTRTVSGDTMYPKKAPRPPTIMHPAYTGDNRSSRYTTDYSVADMSRF